MKERIEEQPGVKEQIRRIQDELKSAQARLDAEMRRLLRSLVAGG